MTTYYFHLQLTKVDLDFNALRVPYHPLSPQRQITFHQEPFSFGTAYLKHRKKTQCLIDARQTPWTWHVSNNFKYIEVEACLEVIGKFFAAAARANRVMLTPSCFQVVWQRQKLPEPTSFNHDDSCSASGPRAELGGRIYSVVPVAQLF